MIYLVRFSPANSATHPEGALLLALCRRDHAEGVEREMLSLLRDDALRARFFELSARLRVQGLTLARTERSPHFSKLPAEVVDEVRGGLKHLQRRAAVMEIERDQLFRALEREALGVVILKGGALTGTVYRDPVERDMADLDLLVGERSLKSATRALQTLGYEMLDAPNAIWLYRRHHFHYVMVKPPSARVELHWGLERRGRPASLDPAIFLRDAVVRPDGLRVPPAEYIVLHLVLQSAHEGFARLSRFVDIDRILDSDAEFNWERLIETAHRSLLAEETAAALQFCHRLLGTPIPDHAVAATLPGTVCRAHVAMLRPLESIFEAKRAPGTDVVMQFWLLDSTSSRVAFLASQFAHDVTFPVTTVPPGLPARLMRFAKLCWLQIRAYGRFALAMGSAGGRRQMRFWSRNASSSERR